MRGCKRRVNEKIVSVIVLFALLISMMFADSALGGANANSVCALAGSTNLTSSMPTRELSWTLGDRFPMTNGRVMFPPIPPQEPASSYDTHWYAGSICPLSLAPQNASSISMSITVPPYQPRPEEFYYVILSAFDSNGSYDQIGFSACYGTWGLTYSWTSGSPYPGSVIYNYDPIAIALSPGATYTFDITTQAGTTHFIAYQRSNMVWSLDAPTGGDYLILSNYYSGGKRGRAPYDYTDYEEVYQTSTPEGAPDFDFIFSNNSWTSTDGSLNAATWTPWYSPDKPFLIPSNVQVVISGNSVIVKNPGTWWPMFHHDLWHNGYSTTTAPNTNQTLWTFATSGPMTIGGVESSPAVADGKVFVGSYDNKTYALNATTGAMVWSYTTGGYVESSPAVAEGIVFVGSWDGKVYALNATTGKLMWSYTTGDVVESSPAVAGGIVFVGSMDQKIYALNATTGKKVWNYTTSYYVHSSPAVAGGVVFVGSDDGEVYALNATTGALVWRSITTGRVYSSPAVAGGVVFVGSKDNIIYAFNASTGRYVWSYGTGGPVWSSPAVAGDVVFIGSFDDKVYALDATTGKLVWSHETGSRVFSSPAVAGGVVFVGSEDNKTYALNATTGALIWSYTTGSWVDSSPAVVNGVVYVGSWDGKIYAFGPPVWPTGGGVGITGYKLVFKETMSNSLNSSVDVDYYWDFSIDKWNGIQWVPTDMTGLSTIVWDCPMPALTTMDLPYPTYLLRVGNSFEVVWGDWLRIDYTFHWTYSSTSYSIDYAPAELNVHPGDIAGAASVTFPDLGADHVVNSKDFGAIAANWLAYTPPMPPTPYPGPNPTTQLARADINGDFFVNSEDIAIIAANWLSTWTNAPPP